MGSRKRSLGPLTLHLDSALGFNWSAGGRGRGTAGLFSPAGGWGAGPPGTAPPARRSFKRQLGGSERGRSRSQSQRN